MKRFFSLLTAAVLAAALCGQALAAGSAELVRTFIYENTLYTYVSLTGTDQPITKAEAKLGNQTFPADHKLETVQQAGSPVTYLLLVDNSNSMPPFREEVAAFGAALAQSSGENTRYILATFGDDFSLVSEDVSAGELAELKSEFILDRELIIGRDEICDIVFDSSAVSHRHARIFTADGVVYLEDLSSQNGTCVNGLPIHMAVVLHSGDEISVGDAVFRFKF